MTTKTFWVLGPGNKKDKFVPKKRAAAVAPTPPAYQATGSTAYSSAYSSSAYGSGGYGAAGTSSAYGYGVPLRSFSHHAFGRKLRGSGKAWSRRACYLDSTASWMHDRTAWVDAWTDGLRSGSARAGGGPPDHLSPRTENPLPPPPSALGIQPATAGIGRPTSPRRRTRTRGPRSPCCFIRDPCR